MMVFYTRSAHEAKRLARAVQTLTGQYAAPVLTADGRYRLQNESYGPEWAVALQSLLRHNVRANYCTPERVGVELERLIRQGKVQRTAAPIPSAHEENGNHSFQSKKDTTAALPNLPTTTIAALANARPEGRQAPKVIPIGGAAVAEREEQTAMPTPPVVEGEASAVPLPDAPRPIPKRTVMEFAKRYGIALRSPQRDEIDGVWKCKLVFVEDAEDVTIYPARCTKQMTCLVPTVKSAPTISNALQHLRDQARDLETRGERFEDWATRHGFSTDSRTAERRWQRARRHLRDLRGFLGAQLLRELTATGD